MSKKAFQMLMFLIILMALTACSGGYTHNNRCFNTFSWSPCEHGTRKFVTVNGTERFYCRDCAETCRDCGGRAREYRTNMLDGIIFFCRSCIRARES